MTSVGAPSGSNAASAIGAAQAPSQREQLKDAAQQFEAIFVRQMLAAARKNNFDKGGMFDSEAMTTFRQMQDEQFADAAAKSGAFGLASMLEAQLARTLPKDQ